MNAVQFSSLLAIIGGLLIIAFPNILEYLVAIILIIIGINGLVFGSKLNKRLKIKIDR